MPIYVGVTMWPFRNMVMGHMFPGGISQVETLHKMADEMGMRRSWFQDRPGLPHYDITASMRRKAIKLGAIPLDTIAEEAAMLEVVMPIFRRYPNR